MPRVSVRHPGDAHFSAPQSEGPHDDPHVILALNFVHFDPHLLSANLLRGKDGGLRYAILESL